MTSASRFIIFGSSYECMAHLQVVAASEAQALAEWQKYFGEKVAGWPKPTVCAVDKESHMDKHWRGHMDAFYAGPYTYDDYGY